MSTHSRSNSSSEFSSAEKVAALLLALGDDLAASLLRAMPPADVKRVATAMSRMRSLDAATVDALLDEFSVVLAQHEARVEGGADTTARLLTQAFGAEEAGTLFERYAVGATRLSALDELSADAIARILIKEHPQTAALVTAFCPPDKAAAVVAALPERLVPEILRRIASLDSVSEDVLVSLNEALEEEAKELSRHSQHSAKGGPEALAKMMQAMDRKEAQRMLEELEARDPALAEDVRARMFRFDDLARLEDQDLATLVGKVPQDKWKVAFKDCRDETREKVLACLSGRARTLVEEDFAALPRMRREDVRAVQDEILTLARELEEAGAIQLPSG